MFWTNISYRGGVLLSTIDLWLDPHGRREWAFISHAHSDHIAAHDEVVLSDGTYHFLRHRKLTPRKALILPFGETRSIRGVELTLYPAGHILGSAQLLAAIDGQRVLYSGDFKLGANKAAEEIAVPHAEVLVMETTYGHRRYAFPAAHAVVAEMVAWCDGCLTDGFTPMLLGYALGKGQEILLALAEHGYTFLLHDTLYQTTRIAENLGVVFPPFARWTPGLGEGAVVLCPPHLRKWLSAKLPPHRTAIVSGWACDAGTRYRYGADAAFCLSDHADYDELMQYVALVQPERIFTVHGFAADFAADLRRAG